MCIPKHLGILMKKELANKFEIIAQRTYDLFAKVDTLVKNQTDEKEKKKLEQVCSNLRHITRKMAKNHYYLNG